MSFRFQLNTSKVYRPHHSGIGACFNCYKNGELVYDQKRDTVREMTVAEIEKALGYPVKVVK